MYLDISLIQPCRFCEVDGLPSAPIHLHHLLARLAGGSHFFPSLLNSCLSTMRVSRLFTQLWLLCGSLVAGGYDARTLEVEFFYRAYRLDVEVSVAEFLADPNNAGKDPNVEKPWKMARNIKSYNQPEDWPDRRIPSRLYGLNFIAWLYGVEADHWHGREAARQRITDPVDPDFFAAFADEKDEKGNYIEPRRSLSRLPRDDGIPLAPLKENSAELADKKQSSYKFSYNSLAMHRVLGDLDMGSGLEGDNRKYYYDMVNVMGEPLPGPFKNTMALLPITELASINTKERQPSSSITAKTCTPNIQKLLDHTTKRWPKR